jgi:hypothetical protein
MNLEELLIFENNMQLLTKLKNYEKYEAFDVNKEIVEIIGKLENIPSIYIFISEEPISRLVGESRILKIGETSHLKKRMIRYFGIEDINILKTSPNRQTAYRLRNYLKNGAKKSIKLFVFYCTGFSKDNLREEEKKLLNLYMEDHFEVPPLNMGLS